MSTARSLNKVMLIGNLTRNPSLRETNNGATVCTFGLATNSTWKDGSGNIQERTEFHNIVAWNKLGEICAQILSTGMLVYVEGELRTRTWDDANGVRHYRTEVKIDDMKLQDDKGKKGVGVDQAKEEGENDEDAYADDELSVTDSKAKVAEDKSDDDDDDNEDKEDKEEQEEEEKEVKSNEGDDLF